MERHHALPLYIRVAETIKSRITSRIYLPGQRIPSARELAEEFRVSNITVRKAVARLTGEGFLQPRQGYGTRVAQTDHELVEIRLTGNFRDWLDSASGRQPQLQVEVMDMAEVPPPDNIRTRMGLEADDVIGRIRRIRRYKGSVVSYFLNYMEPDDLARINRTDLKKRSFVEVFQEKTGKPLIRVEQRVEAAIADMEVAEILETDFGSPLFHVENDYYSGDASPIVISKMYYRGDSYVYRTSITLSKKRSNLSVEQPE